MSLVTRAQLDRAVETAKRDFSSCGLYSRALDDVPVRLTGWGDAYGYCDETGEIEIPAWSWSRLVEEREGAACSLEDVVRHELAHALAHRHLELVDTPRFGRVFGAAYWDEWADEVDFDPHEYVTEYATTAPCEDFAETVMVFTRHRGRISRYAARRGVMRGFRYIAGLSRMLRPLRGTPKLAFVRPRRRTRRVGQNGRSMPSASWVPCTVELPARLVQSCDSSSPAEAGPERIIDALDQCGGNQTRAAEMLGISRRTLVHRLDEFDLPRPRKR